jgi:NAD(P)-dependent dehydrogenase (short-subunit alcohol dehydrogenase family)
MNSNYDLKNKVALCVGATAGIGKAMALKLAECGASVTIMGRNEKIGKEIVKELEKKNPLGIHNLILCDAMSMRSIKQACNEYKSSVSKLNYVVFTQGIATTQGRTETMEGLDQKMAIHYYGRVMFCLELLDILNQTATSEDVRVLSIFSGGKHSAYTGSDLDLKSNYTLSNAANACGFYNDLAMDQLSRENSNITFIHAAPGFVRTNWGTELNCCLKCLTRFIQLCAVSPETCANNMIHGIGGSHMKGSFHIMDRKGNEGSKTLSHNDHYRELVWDHTKEMLKNVSSRDKITLI